MKLTREDRDSVTWRKLRAYVQERVQKLRVSNDDPKKSDLETAALRGKIAELNHILTLEEAPVANPTAPPEDKF